jgi:hypothetical protein
MRNTLPINYFPPTLFLTNRSPLYGEAHLFSQPASRLRLEFELGANPFALKRAVATDLWPAIEAVQGGGSFISPGVEQHMLIDPPPEANQDCNRLHSTHFLSHDYHRSANKSL